MQASDLHVVLVYNNNRRWKNRETLLKKCVLHMISSGVSVHLVELVIGQRPFVYEDDDPVVQGITYHKIRGTEEHECWIKEALQKYVVARFPASVKYMAIIDADIHFCDPNWALSTLDMLQMYPVGQPWSYAVDLDAHNNPIEKDNGRTIDRSFSLAWQEGDIVITHDDYGPGQPSVRWMKRDRKPDNRAHVGYAWAFRVETWRAIEGLPDWFISGAADHFSAMAFAGKMAQREDMQSPGAQRRLKRYVDLCNKHVKQSIGVVPGMITHGFHGDKKNRFYANRRHMLMEANFDPDIDLGYDLHGLPIIISDNRILRDGLRRLSVIRDEDSSLTY